MFSGFFLQKRNPHIEDEMNLDKQREQRHY